MSERDSICAAEEKLPDNYREIPGWPGYFLSEDGTPWTNWYMGRDELGRIVRLKSCAITKLKTVKNRFGYHLLRLSDGGRRSCGMLSRAMLLTFCGPAQPGMCACHNDGNKDNNHISNLRWDTRAGNEADKVSHGTSNRGDRNGMAKYSDSLVVELRRRYAELPVVNGLRPHGSVRRLAEEFGLTARIATNLICRGRKHV